MIYYKEKDKNETANGCELIVVLINNENQVTSPDNTFL